MKYLLMMLIALLSADVPVTVSVVTAQASPSYTGIPGAINPLVTQRNINRTICVKGWSGTQRPPTSYTTPIKKRLFTDLKLTGSIKDYELDHDISIELGGNPKDLNNLWMEPWNGVYGARTKDKLENRLHTLVCNGKLPLKTAQHDIAADWVAAYQKYIGPLDK